MNLSRAIITAINSVTGMFRTVEIHRTKRLSIEGIKNINLESTTTIPSPDIRVMPSDEDDIFLELRGRTNRNWEGAWKLQTHNDQETLHIVLKGHINPFLNLGFTIGSLKLNVRIPRKDYDSIAIRTSSGGITLEDLVANTLSLQASSGGIHAKNGVAHSLYTIKTSSGSIRASDNQATRFELQANSGGISAYDNRSEKFECQANSGGLSIENHHAAESTFRTSSGGIKGTNIKGSVTAQASSGSIKFSELELTEDWSVKTSSGSVSLQLLKPQPLALTFHGSSGSGHVKVDDMEYEVKSEHALVGEIGSGGPNVKVITSSGSFRLS